MAKNIHKKKTVTIKPPVKKVTKSREKFEDRFLKSSRPFLWLFSIAFLIYFQTLSYDYTYHDDDDLIVNQKGYLSKISNIPGTFSESVFRTQGDNYYYRPVLTISLIMDTVIGKGKPVFYHLSNVLLHAFCTILVFLLLIKLNIPKKTAFILSLFFSIHPVLMQAVAWIPGRNDMLLALFVLLAIISFIIYTEKKNMLWLMAHFVFFILAMFTKETAIVLPFIILSYCFFFNKIKQTKYILLISLFTWALIIIPWFIIRNHVVAGRDILQAINIADFIGQSAIAFIIYFFKIFIPVNLAAIPAKEDSPALSGMIFMIVFLAANVYLGLKDKRKAFFGATWYLIFILPSIAITTSLPVYFENRLYIPLIGVLIFLPSSNIDKIFKNRNTLKTACLLLLGLFFVIKLLNYSSGFKDRHTFVKQAVTDSPHSGFAWYNMAKLYDIEQKTDTAILAYENAVKFDFLEAFCRNRLVLHYIKVGEFSKAIHEANTIISKNLNDDKYIYLELIKLYELTGQYELADSTLNACEAKLTEAKYQKELDKLKIGMRKAQDTQNGDTHPESP